MQMGPMQKALVGAGLADRPKEKKKKQQKQLNCRKCGKPLTRIKDTNIAACEHCEKKASYFIMDHLN